MNKNVLSYIIMIIFMLLLSSCQQNPNKIVVRNKEDSKLMEIINENETEEQQRNIVEEEEQNDINVYEKWHEEIVSNNKKFLCYIDAEYNDIVEESVPVIKVSPYSFVPEDILRYLNVLAPDIEFYIHGDGTPELPMTKAEIETSIIYLKKELNDKNSTLNQLKERSQEQYEERKEIIESEIKMLEKQYDSALEDIEVEKLNINEDLMDQGFMATSKKQMNIDVSGLTYNLKVSSCNAYEGMVNGFSITISTYNFDMTEFSKKISTKDAILLAEKMIEKLSFNNMKYCYSEERSGLFNIVFMRSYNNILSNYTLQDIEFSNPDYPSYSIGWPNEKIILKYNEFGILKALIYEYPLYEKETLNNNVCLLSFEDIKDIFRQQIKTEGMWLENENILSRTYYINNITFGMMKIRIKDSGDEYMVVPVWDFYGYSVDKYDSQDSTRYQLDEKNEYVSNEYPYSFLTINAIDGSIIDRSLGY